MLEGITRLLCQNVGGGAGFIFAPRVADADECREAMGEAGLDLEAHRVVGLVEEGPAFAVAQFDEDCAAILHHEGRDLTRPGALVFPVHVLRTDLDAGALQQVRNLGDVRKGRNDEGLRGGGVGKGRGLERFGVAHRIRPQLVHLPACADPRNLARHVSLSPICSAELLPSLAPKQHSRRKHNGQRAHESAAQQRIHLTRTLV